MGISSGEALKCHQCNSYIQALCADPFSNEEADGSNTSKTGEFLKDCPADNKNYTMCRKFYQNVRGDERVIRSCGYEEYENSESEKKDCYTTRSQEYNTYVCTCKGDGCNGSNI